MRDLLAVAIVGALPSAPVRADGLRIDDVEVATAIPAAQSDAELKAAKASINFWNTGDDAALKIAIAPDFTDHTLPPGRLQGPEGPAFASKTFRAAIPDLSVEIRKMIVTGDYVTVHMAFKGHFTGVFDSTKGKGQAIEFIATDLLRMWNR